MAKVYFNQTLDFSSEVIWSAKNGATRRELKLINKVVKGGETNVLECQLGTLDKGNHSFIFLNTPKKNDNRIFGIFLNSSYSYEVVEGEEVFANHSSGGYGNSCSTFGIYKVGTLLKVHTYKFRNPPTYYKLSENGWEVVENYIVEQNEMKEI